MALELVGGAVLGASVAELFKAVKAAKEKDTNFQQALTRLECTLRSVNPRVRQIIKLNKKLNIPNDELKELITILQNGKALVYKCSQISYINLVRKGQYSNQLLELDYSLLRYFQTILPLDHAIDTKKMLLMIRDLHKGLVGVNDDGGESSKLMEDEDSEVQSSQDSEEIDTMRQLTDTKEEKVNRGTMTWKNRLKGCLYNFDMENTTYLMEENAKFIPEIEEIKEGQGKDTWKFRLNGCVYNFDMKDNKYNTECCVGVEKKRYDVSDCECARRCEHAKVMVMRYEEVEMSEALCLRWDKIVTRDEKSVKFRVEKDEFVEQMETLRNVGNHPNIFPPPIGYCFHSSGTILFFDNIHIITSSLFSKLHECSRGRRLSSYEVPPYVPELAWDNELKISLGVARGISHLHSVGFVHGNLNSSNVLLTSDFDSYISAYGLKYFSTANKQSDVHSFGILLVEILSRIPSDERAIFDGKNWRDYFAPSQFDWGYLDNQDNHQMLNIAMECVGVDPGKRPSMEDVVVMLEKIKQY